MIYYRFESYYLRMAKFFLKSKNKVFRVRRKNIHWFELQTENVTKKITLNKLLLSAVKSQKTYKNKILLHMTNILDNYLLKLNSTLYTHKVTDLYFFKNNTTMLYSVYMDFLKNTVIRTTTSPEYIDKLNNLGTQAVVFSSPKKQMYAVIINNTPSLIFSAGLMRLAMNLEAKCSKKSKIVIINSLKFVWLMAAKLLDENYFFIKFVRNIVYMQPIFLQLEKANLSNKVTHILFEPKVQFDVLNRYKRSSLKKNLRKRKKYSAE